MMHVTQTPDLCFIPHKIPDPRTGTKHKNASTQKGNLNLSRAIGDLMYKADEALSPEEQMITADPELKTLDLTPEDEFIVLACDGVWNSLSSQEVRRNGKFEGAGGRSRERRERATARAGGRGWWCRVAFPNVTLRRAYLAVW